MILGGFRFLRFRGDGGRPALGSLISMVDLNDFIKIGQNAM